MYVCLLLTKILVALGWRVGKHQNWRFWQEKLGGRQKDFTANFRSLALEIHVLRSGYVEAAQGFGQVEAVSQANLRK